MHLDSTMTPPASNGRKRRGSLWRPVVWIGAACLLLLPLVAMQFTREVNWTGSDFMVFGVMLLLACGTFELGLRMSDKRAYRAGMGLAALTGFLLVWIDLAVGIIGETDNPANLMFAGVLLVGIAGALVARFRAEGMARAMVATAIAQLLAGAVAFFGVMATEAVILCAVFAGLWLLSALCFRQAGIGSAGSVNGSQF